MRYVNIWIFQTKYSITRKKIKQNSTICQFFFNKLYLLCYSSVIDIFSEFRWRFSGDGKRTPAKSLWQIPVPVRKSTLEYISLPESSFQDWIWTNNSRIFLSEKYNGTYAKLRAEWSGYRSFFRSKCTSGRRFPQSRPCRGQPARTCGSSWSDDGNHNGKQAPLGQGVVDFNSVLMTDCFQRISSSVIICKIKGNLQMIQFPVEKSADFLKSSWKSRKSMIYFHNVEKYVFWA